MTTLLFTGGYDDRITRWEISTGKHLQKITFEHTMNRMVITPDGSYLVVATNPYVKIFNLKERALQPIKVYDGHKGNVTGIGVSREGQYFYSCSEDGTAKTWEMRSCSTFRSMSFNSGCNSIALHPNQSEMIVGLQDGRLCIWDTRNNIVSQEVIPEMNESIQSVDVSSDGTQIAVLQTHGKCYVYNTNMKDNKIGTLELISEFIAHNKFGTICKYSPNNQYLATASADKSIKIWNTKTFELIKTLNGHEGWVWDIAFSNNNEYLISASTDATAKLWDINSGEISQKYEGHEKGIVCLALYDKMN